MSLAASTHNTDRNYAILLKKLSIALSFVFLSSINTELSAQDNVGDDSTVIYPASYFSEYSPVTALDMINRIPGMSVGNSAGGRSSGGSPGSNAGRGGRGFGGGGGGTQIMINGKRTAGKNNNSQTQLVRINADQVDYIELIRGTGGDLDVRGGTQVANVVLYEQLSDTSISY
ncbi:MAG: TonB-dependent receptor plug domain-containing protein, partial [Gammaproteobacteria bacterium]|nr:TonB-dependent receptor plug domain-containing protein [Gammaproteobacteria bacterium]